MSVRALQAFSIAHCTDQKNLFHFVHYESDTFCGLYSKLRHVTNQLINMHMFLCTVYT